MKTEITIEKGIPLPTKRNGRRGHFSQVFDKMEVGDSVVLDNKGRANFIQYMRRKNKAFATRVIESENNVPRYRCWRVDGRRKAA